MPSRTPSVAGSSADRPALAARPSRQRSAVTNGTVLLPEGGNSTAWARRVLDLIALHEDDVGERTMLSEAERSLVRRCAVLEVELERMECDMATGKDVSLDLYQRCTNTLGRQLDRLGIKRASRATGRNPLAEAYGLPDRTSRT